MQKERKGSKMKKLLAMATSLALLATSAIVPMTAAAAEEKEVTKPEKITIMVDTTLVNQANGRDAFEARWEELTGIDLVINQPDHSAYYDVMQQTMADPDQWPDVLIMSSTYYSDFAANGALWDMTEAWENSNTKNSGRFTGDSVIEGLKINGLSCPRQRLRHLRQEGVDGQGWHHQGAYQLGRIRCHARRLL